MRAIQKGLEPRSLSQHRASSHADFDNYEGKDALRKALAGEQRGLCCYCLSRIAPNPRGMKIEHWRSQSKFPEEQLDYANLLGACSGNEGQPGSRQHSDARKGNRPLLRNPANRNHAVEEFIQYELDGRITSQDPDFDAELREVLNLNLAFLRNNRKATLDAFTKSLGGRQELEKHLRKWNGDSHAGNLAPFCQVVVYWLRRRLSRAG